MPPDLRYELLRHALGIHSYGGRRWKKPYRNHFCAAGDDVQAWEAMEKVGLARRVSGPTELNGMTITFVVTEEGRSVAMEGLVPRKRWAYGVPDHGELW